MRYKKASRVAEEMTSSGLECFVPPKISNMLFVHTGRESLDDFLHFRETGQQLYYQYSRIDKQPIIVPDAEMDCFIKLCDSSELPMVFPEAPKVKLGDRVKVVDGPLKGLEGNVVRIRKQKRVLINVGNVVWAATEYIRPEMLEIVK